MEYCSKCQAPETMVILFDAVLPEGIVKICGKCSTNEDIPIIKETILQEEKFQEELKIQDRLAKISGVKLEERKSDENLKQIDENLRETVKENFVKDLTFDLNLKKELIDNFHWIVMRARRMKHLTQEQLAREIQEPEEVIKMIEKGDVPQRRNIIRKLENHLNIVITNGFRDERQQEDSIPIRTSGNEENKDFNIKDMSNLTIADLQEMRNKEKKLKEGELNESFKDFE
jgi:ribosome-binding protein aMBF1 (putative translation factor)|tara:strand:+ start:78 stop:767 length:690 start_codon:yes stop_codon:yes gene_type:complete